MRNSHNEIQNRIESLKVLMVIAITLFFCAGASAQSPVNFSGNWAFNEGKSKLGDGPMRMAPITLVVTQDGNNLSTERTMTGRDGNEIKMSGKYTLDGKECENSGFMNMKMKSTITWAADKKSLTIASTTVFNMNGESMEMKSTEIWKLEGDKTLKIEATNTTPNGDMSRTLVYDKK